MALYSRSLTPLYVATLVIFAFSSSPAQKISAEEVVAKHLESIGSAEARKGIKNQVASGLVQYTVLRKQTGGSGRIVIASEGQKLIYGMTFSIPSYPAETVVFDGKNVKVAFAISNARSEFGDYLYRYKDTVTEGLLGGVLNTGWALTDLSSRKAKLAFGGTRKVGNRQTYVLNYLPKGGSDIDISIFIDQQTFEHVRTEYRRVISSIIGPGPDASAQQREQRQTLMEEFGDYKKENGLNMPHSYRAYVRLDGAAGVREYEYKAIFSDFFFNQQLDSNSFVIATE